MLTVGNEDDIISIFDAWIKVPSYLPPEQADHYVLGLSGYLTEQTSLSLESYHKHYNSLVVYNQDKILPNDPDYVQGTGNADGVELMVRSRLTLVDLYGAYSLSWVRVDNEGMIYYPRLRSSSSHQPHGSDASDEGAESKPQMGIRLGLSVLGDHRLLQPSHA